jgi:hypothetical protein
MATVTKNDQDEDDGDLGGIGRFETGQLARLDEERRRQKQKGADDD